MHIHEANEALRDLAVTIITGQMVAALLAKPVDLYDDAAVVIRLSCAGFGAASIAALMDEARNDAMQRRIEEARDYRERGLRDAVAMIGGIR